MAIDQLRLKPIEDVIDRKCPLLLRHLGIKQHLEEKITELAAQFVPITVSMALEHFVSLFQREGLDGVRRSARDPTGTRPGHAAWP